MSWQGMPIYTHPAAYADPAAYAAALHPFMTYLKNCVVCSMNQTGVILSDDKIMQLVENILSGYSTVDLFRGGIEIDLELTLRDILITNITAQTMKELLPMFNAAHIVDRDAKINALENITRGAMSFKPASPPLLLHMFAF